MMTAYAICLGIACAFAAFAAYRANDGPLLRCAFAIMANWVAGMIVSYMIATDAWQMNIPIDSITAAVCLWRPAGRWQAALGASYVAQLASHVGYGARVLFGGGADAMAYYDFLTVVAFLQLLILGSWGVADIWGRASHHRTGRYPRAATTLDRYVEKP